MSLSRREAAGRVAGGLRIAADRRAGSDGGVLEVEDPASGDIIASVADATVDDAGRAVDAAHAAAAGWARTPPRERAEILARAHALMVDRLDELAMLIVAENGKVLSDARSEVRYAAEFFRWYAEEAVRINGSLTTAPGGGNRILVTHQPVGIAVLVTPWNFPAAMVTRKVGPALAAGCTVVLKPAAETPLTALVLADILGEAGVPPGVVNVVPTTRPDDLVDVMLADARVRKLSFTGSTQVGRVLLARAARHVVNTSMELGGNAPFLVFADADLDVTVAGAMAAKMRNGGEACTAANRFFVEQPVAEEFSARMAAAMSALRLGPGDSDGAQVGPLVSAAARQKVAGLVEAAVTSGARTLAGGETVDGPGYFYRPTVLTDVAPASAILDAEIFGPVSPVVTFTSEQQAITMANATEYGLASYVFTGDLAKGLRVSEALEYGMVGINQGMISDVAAPFGGVKQSGIGREGGSEGLLAYTESKYVAVQW